MSRLRKVKPGDGINGLSAGDWNAFIDTARDVQRLRRVGAVPPPSERQQTVKVRNIAASDIDMGGIVSLDAPIFGPSDNLAEFRHRFSFDASIPSAATKGRIGVAVEPIAQGRIGRVLTSGLAVCRVDVTDPTADYASESAGVHDRLLTSANGHARIVWRESGDSGLKWAIVWLSMVAPRIARPTHRITGSTVVISGSTPQWRYTIQAISGFAAGSWTSSGPSLFAYNFAEDQTNYQHGQALVLGTGATLTPVAVQGPVIAHPTGLFEGPDEIYAFDMMNPMTAVCS